MKTPKAKTATTAAVTAEAPFFQKGNGGNFFAKGDAHDSFFSPGATPLVQTKLTIGAPNDKYEKEADSMADKVVQKSSKEKIQAKAIKGIQTKLTVGKPNDTFEKEADSTADKVVRRLAIPDRKTNEPQTKPMAQRITPLVQAKCSACEEEEKLQKKEEDVQESPKELQRKPIFNELPGPPTEDGNSRPQKATPLLQKKYSAFEKNGALQTKPIFESEASAEEGIQRKCSSDSPVNISSISNATAPASIQRACRECDEGNEVFLKSEGFIQRSADSEQHSNGSRESIVAAAKSQVGKVSAKQDDGTGKRVGSEYLLEYFHVAAPGVWDDSIIETAGAEMPSWCGIFSVWAHKKAGKNIGDWQMGRGVSAFGTLTQTQDPVPGDIGYIDQPYQHHCIIERIEGDNIHSIDGNSGALSEVKENIRPRAKYSGFFTAFGAGQSEEVQRKEDIQTKDDTTNAGSPSVETSLKSSKGGGTALPGNVRTNMESAFGADFSSVRIHTDTSAVQMSKSLHAHAFTHGSDIYFNSGKFDTTSTGGSHLLAHELTHVIQQGSAPTQNDVHRSAITNPETEAPAEGVPTEEESADMEQQVEEDMNRDDFGGPETGEGMDPATEGSDADEADQEVDPGGPAAEEESAPPAEGASSETQEDQSDGEEAEEADPETEGGEPGEDEASVPDGTPVEGREEDCPNLVPEFPEPPAHDTIEEEEESFYEELLSFVSLGGFSVGRILGGGAYFAWRRLPLSVKVTAINFVLDRAINGAYMGRILGRYGNMGSGMLSAVLIGFFRRLRTMEDVQKVRLFEKFGRIILRGDLNFAWGLIKGIVIGFFLDGLLGIIQMVIDVICLVPKILNFFRSIGNFLQNLPFEVGLILEHIKEMMSSVGDLVSNAMSELMDMVRNPERLMGIIDSAYASATAAAENIGTSVANTLVRYAALPSEALGTIAGRIGGQVLFEGLLAYLTGPGGAAVTAAKLSLRIAGRAMAQIGRQIFTIVRHLGRVLGFIRRAIGSIIRFLTPILRSIAQLARRIAQRIGNLFRVFRRNCRPGSLICTVPHQPRARRCHGRFIPRLGGHIVHNNYVRRTTRQARDYRLHAPFFGTRVLCNYDAKMTGGILVEGKTGYRYLHDGEYGLPRTNPSRFRFIMMRLNEQRFRCMAIAARCGYPYIWYMQSPHAAAFLNHRWSGFPPVLHRP